MRENEWNKNEIRHGTKEMVVLEPDHRLDSDHRTSLGLLEKRNKAISVAWWIVLPAAAVLTTDVWLMENENVRIITLNVTGAMMEGFFGAWESGIVVSYSISTDLVQTLADVIRAFFLSTYTSWAGMVGFAASLAHKQGSIYWGILYMVASIMLGFIAHGVGSSIAKLISNRERKNSRIWSQSQVHNLVNTVLIFLIIYVVVSYALVVAHVRNFSDAFASARYFISSGVDDQQLLVAMLCSIAGAYTGNLVGNIVDAFDTGKRIPMGTLFCNTAFTALSLLLSVFTLRNPLVWQDSIWLAQFCSSFCGAASAFAGHISDLKHLWVRDTPKHAMQNAIINLAASSVLVFIGMELERLLSEDADESNQSEADEL